MYAGWGGVEWRCMEHGVEWSRVEWMMGVEWSGGVWSMGVEWGGSVYMMV